MNNGVKEEFISFDSFLVKKNDIIFAKIHNLKSIIMTIKVGNDTKQLQMDYADSYDAKNALDRLSGDVDSFTVDHWKHSLVKQMYFSREIVREARNEITVIRRELKSLRMELRRNRLKLEVKKDE